ncbi:hypothetical protein ElyMa_003944100 [Elysia marginata]|uniref:Down syndrome cell adhesion molecule C-terminal domain-containing protein n=1 Tax=Elysia marginata TaxID=1093978 RepID=A0AAV4FSX1_9GAST|nr:hypothetical protein ElyMa_003944100 [Elysia marginata]
MLVVIVCCVIVVIIVIIVIVVLVKQKRKGEVYNAKDEEAKADNGQQQGAEFSQPLMIQDDANPYDRPNANNASLNYYGGQGKPISPSGHTASPYMVSGLHLPHGEPEQMELPPKKKKTSLDSSSRDKGNGKPPGRYAKKGESKDAAKGGKAESNNQEPPTPKKRSIFLTESNEALDKITEAVRGGMGSGPDGGRAKESQI